MIREAKENLKILVCVQAPRESLRDLETIGAKLDFWQPEIPLNQLIADYDGLIIDQHVVIDETLLSSAEKLVMIGKIDKETANLDLMAATKRGIAVLNISAGVSVALAEYTMLLLLRLAREIKPLGIELKGRTLGIIGLGNVGVQLAKRASAFDLKVLAYDAKASRARALMNDVELVTLEELLTLSDFISLNVPLTPQTLAIIGERELALLKKDACLINVQEPQLCDVPKLAEALSKGHLAGAAFDLPIGAQEIKSLLSAYPQVIITEHLAAQTAEAKIGAVKEIAAEMAVFSQEGYSANVINMPLIKESQRHIFTAFNDLAAILADGLGQLTTKQNFVAITYGSAVEVDFAPLNQTMLYHLFKRQGWTHFNYISAASKAEEAGITVTTAKAPFISDDIRLTYGKHCFAGRLATDKTFRISSIDDFLLEIVPKGQLLLVLHDNKPGMIGLVGTILGQSKINIAKMVVGHRCDDNRKALMALTIDGQMTAEMIAAIASHEGIDDVNLLHFT